jgi:hypothetical protein
MILMIGASEGMMGSEIHKCPLVTCVAFERWHPNQPGALIVAFQWALTAACQPLENSSSQPLRRLGVVWRDGDRSLFLFFSSAARDSH